MSRAIRFLLNAEVLNNTKELFVKEYSSNLYHINHFSKNSKNVAYQQVFNDFLLSFRILRNVRKGKTKNLLAATHEWLKDSRNVNDVDGFAKKLKMEGITQVNKTMTSLASKILFLNNPYEISPYDALARVALGFDNMKFNYKEFQEGFLSFQNYCEEDNSFIRCYSSVSNFACVVEKEYNIFNPEK